MSTDENGLVSRAFDPLPLGSIRPRGWLRTQLQIQADGLTGNVDEIWEDLSNNAWLGGDRDGWERGPYYADGLVPLSYLLEDEHLRRKAETWIEGFLDSQDEEGWFSPKQVWGPVNPDDPWPRYVVCKALRQYYEATDDERAIEAIRSFAAYLLEHSSDWSIEDWAAMRWMDLGVTLHWLYERDGERWVLDVVDLLDGRGFDWTDHFRDFQFTGSQLDDPQMATHVVNNAMGVKAPAVDYRQNGDQADHDAVYEGIENLDRFHGQVTGVFTGDEHFAGKNPSQGTELCAVVEYMYSLEYLASVLGDPSFGDRLERIAYNALPAAFTPDMWAHQYDQQVNQVLVNVAERSWTNDPSANIFGQTPNFGCCHANFHQGWPKFTASLWMGSSDGGLACIAYAPCEVTTTLETGETVTIVEETEYPFDDTVNLRVQVDEPTTFPLHLRIPAWSEEPAITLPDGETTSPEPDTYFEHTREWHAGSEIELALDPPMEARRGHHGSVALRRGPLVFSLPIRAESELIGGRAPHGDWEFYPTEVWNYGIDVDTDRPGSSVELTTRRPADTPFSPDHPPVELTVSGRLVSEWRLEDNWAGQIPHSPARSHEEVEALTLIPYGATTLRVTEFPLLE